ncbi:MAG TPA: alpha/beta hydrolase [Candidatus Acidoferrales bacterium]|nr:alpha/beta hydrolase [Candidatus Acidoferrales bacterium]
MPKRLPRARTLKGEPPLAYFDSAPTASDEYAILLIHSSSTRSEDWENIYPRLATRYRTIAYDQRGHGKSGRASRYSLTDFVDDGVRMVRQVVKGPVVIIGHSLGAATAIGIAALEPDEVVALILEEPPIAFMKDWDPKRPQAIHDALQQVEDPKAFLRAVEKLPLSSPGPRGERTFGEARGFYAAERMITYIRDIDPAFPASRAAGPDEEGAAALNEWLPKLTCPVLLMAGEVRLGSFIDDAAEWKVKRAVKSLTVKRFPGTGHLIHGYRPEQFLENIEPFLRGLRG